MDILIIASIGAAIGYGLGGTKKAGAIGSIIAIALYSLLLGLIVAWGFGLFH